jgi:hypothetical protein
MSGYLRRVAGAVSAKARVHPFVEGIYGGRTESAAPVVKEVERRVVAPARVSEAESRERTAGVVRPLLDERNDATEPVQVRPASQISERSAERLEKGLEGERFETLLPEVVGEGGFVHTKQQSEAHGDEVAERERAIDSFAMRLQKDGSPGAQAGKTRSEGSKPMADPRAPEALHPVVRDEAVKDGAAGLLPPAHRDKAAMDGAAGRMAQRRMERQSDEIQIHIGRIEVIAMPPAAPKMVAAPARKTQSLDEYLRQRNGRPG